VCVCVYIYILTFYKSARVYYTSPRICKNIDLINGTHDGLRKRADGAHDTQREDNQHNDIQHNNK